MHPEYPDFETLDASRREVLTPYLAFARQPICDLSLANLCLWQECERATYTFIEGHLCILIQPHDGPSYFLEPLGSGPVFKAAALCLNHVPRISRAGEALVAELPQELFQAMPLRDHFDYLYQVAEIAELKGNKHDGKRNQIKKFTRNNPAYRLTPLARDHREQALAVFEQWSQKRPENGVSRDRGTVPATGAECQRMALEKAFDEFEDLSISGLAVFTENRMQGFVLGSALNAETAVIHFLYADSSLRGIYQLLLQESCRAVFSRYRLLNMEEDLGIPSLRRTKMSYNPLRLEKKFLITPRLADR